MVEIRHLIEIIDDIQNRSVAGKNSQNRRDIQPVVNITDYSLSADVQRRLTDGQRGLESAAFASNLWWIDEGFRKRRPAGHVLRGISVKRVEPRAWSVLLLLLQELPATTATKRTNPIAVKIDLRNLVALRRSRIKASFLS
jgi:hypothetical protein